MSDAIMKRVTDLEDRIVRVESEARSCVQELLVEDSGRFLIAERLPALGSVVLPAIRELMNDIDMPADVSALAALVGFEVGDREQSLAVLLEEISARGEFAPVAAHRLARARIPEAEGPIREALSSTDVTDVDSVVSYLEALPRLGARLNDDERRRLAHCGAWQVETAIEQWHSYASPEPID